MLLLTNTSHLKIPSSGFAAPSGGGSWRIAVYLIRLWGGRHFELAPAWLIATASDNTKQDVRKLLPSLFTLTP